MFAELNVRFPDKDHVILRFGDAETTALPFTNPLTSQDRKRLQWYLEMYGAHSLGDPDDQEAKAIVDKLPEWGKALFKAVFQHDDARNAFADFRQQRDGTRLVTISANHPSILALPWELLHDTATGRGFLFMENPRISIRRRVAGATGGSQPFAVKAKDTLHLLFVVARPEGSGFLDPRADPSAVLEALDDHGDGRVTTEFLRPPALDALIDRLENKRLPKVDVIHFDGHGVFDEDGGMPTRARKAENRRGGNAENFMRVDTGAPAGPLTTEPPDTGYLLFEDAEGKLDFVSAEKLGENLHQHEVSLVILSACQSAAIGFGDGNQADSDAPARPMGSVAARLTSTGIPAVIAMTHSVLPLAIICNQPVQSRGCFCREPTMPVRGDSKSG